MTDRLLDDGIRGKGEKTLVAGKRQARISEALMALSLEEPGIVGRAVNQYGPFEMDQRLGRVASVQLEHAELDQGFCPLGREIDGLDEALLRLVQLAGLNTETPELDDRIHIGWIGLGEGLQFENAFHGACPADFLDRSRYGIHRNGFLLSLIHI